MKHVHRDQRPGNSRKRKAERRAGGQRGPANTAPKPKAGETGEARELANIRNRIRRGKLPRLHGKRIQYKTQSGRNIRRATRVEFVA